VNYALPTATDNYDESVSVECLASSGSFFAVGKNVVSCNASDARGNTAQPVSFTVTVIDTQAPIITLNGSSMAIAYGSVFLDPGATVVDNSDPLPTIKTFGAVNAFVPGVYTMVYTAYDSNGNNSSVSRTVTVNQPPASVASNQTTNPANPANFTSVAGTSTTETEDSTEPSPTPTNTVALQDENYLTEVKGTEDKQNSVFNNYWWLWMVFAIIISSVFWFLIARRRKARDY
jgi:hypothetical protein